MTIIGIDFGGTWIRAALVGKAGLLSEIKRKETGSHRSPELIIKEIVGFVDEIKAESKSTITGVGMGIPTTLNENGLLSDCPNLPTMGGIPLRAELENRFGLRISLINDADAFTFGEWRWGAGRGTNTILGITLGTSIGLGIIINSRLIRGEHGEAGEIWRSPIILHQESGENLHAGLGAAALTVAYQAETGRILEPSEVSTAAAAGDDVAAAVISRYTVLLGRTMLWLANILDPEIIILGGSVVNNYGIMKDELATLLKDSKVLFGKSELGENAALLGAAASAMSEIEDIMDE